MNAELRELSPSETPADAALGLARNYRIPVFPCGKDKKPLTKHGFKDATTDVGQLRRWWTRFPGALIGVPTGSASGLLVIDVDPAGVDFILGEHGDLLDEGRQHNTRRGFHYLFCAPADVSIGCSAGKLAEGVDVRGDGGYIIWWPAAGLRVFGPEIDKLPLPPDSWQGRKATKGKVVFVLAEGAMGFRNRLLAYAKTHAGTFPGVRIIGSAPNLLGEQDHVLLANEIEASGGADLIVIDTLAASSPGADENAAKDMGKVIDHCKRLHHATGATVLLIHHSGKDESKGARGWSGLRAAADAEIEVNRYSDDRTATVTKLKDGEDGAKFAFRLVPVQIAFDADGEPVNSCIVESLAVVPANNKREPRPGTIERALLEAIRGDLSTDGLVSVSLVIETVVSQLPRPEGRDTRKQHLSRALRALAAKGLIAIEGEQCRSL